LFSIVVPVCKLLFPRKKAVFSTKKNIGAVCLFAHWYCNFKINHGGLLYVADASFTLNVAEV
jgi:hypothetical protein